ncbi:MAG: amidohydrolase family protein [Balneolaceae bacterium]|nr:amidohydrolase family protein [Balneolaceae bacterium]MCH8550051.1 amidohydrolase family protein [Balneolaceae bacterium]
MKSLPLFALILLLFVACSEEQPFHLVIENVNILDVESGDILENRYLYIRDGVISEITETPSDVESAETIDGSGRWLIPGLWDMHVHFRGGEELIEENANLLPLYIAHGVTSVRDAGGDVTPSIMEWRSEIQNGERSGPYIYTSGPKIDGPGYRWPGSIAVENLDDIHAAMDSLESIGVDFVKVNDSALNPELFLPAIQAARERNLPVTGHMPFEVIFSESVEAGLTATEHIFYAYKGASSDEQAITRELVESRGTDNPLGFLGALMRVSETQNESTLLELSELMIEEGTGIIPTLYIMDVLANLRHIDHTEDEFLNYIGPGIQETYRGRLELALQASDDQPNIYDLPGYSELVRQLDENGVTIYAGSDAGPYNSFVYPGISLHKELQLLTDSGLSPAAALRAATVNAASFFDKDNQYGLIREGFKADLVLLNSNPLQNIQYTTDIRYVIQNGNRIYGEGEIDEIFNTAESHANQ